MSDDSAPPYAAIIWYDGWNVSDVSDDAPVGGNHGDCGYVRLDLYETLRDEVDRLTEKLGQSFMAYERAGKDAEITRLRAEVERLTLERDRLYDREAALAKERDTIIEQCAEVCDNFGIEYHDTVSIKCAAAIRAMKG